MKSPVFHRGLKELNQDGVEYVRWKTSKKPDTPLMGIADLEELQRFAEFGRIKRKLST